MNKDMARRVNSDAAHVAFLVDGDKAGRRLASTIRGAGIDPNHVVVLGGEKSELDLEDLIDKGLYLEAVNEELRLKGAAFELSAANLEGDGGRIDNVNRACKENGAKAPEKPAVARRCLEIWQEARRDPETEDRSLVAADMQDTVGAMFDKLMAIVDP